MLYISEAYKITFLNQRLRRTLIHRHHAPHANAAPDSACHPLLWVVCTRRAGNLASRGVSATAAVVIANIISTIELSMKGKAGSALFGAATTY